MSLLEGLKRFTTIVADTGELAAIERLKPRDATTNPSLILKAAQKPEYRPLVVEAVRSSSRDGADGRVDSVLVAFGARILEVIPGRVSTEVDARISFDTRATVERARRLIERYVRHGVNPQRVLIKIAATASIRSANRRERIRFLKFSVVGAIGAIVDFGVLNILHLVFGVPVILANVFSFTLAVLSNFVWNRYWTYPESRSKPVIGQLGQFFVVNIAGLAINTFVLWALLGMTTRYFGTYGYNIAKGIATGLVLFWNFFINRYWTYSDVK